VGRGTTSADLAYTGTSGSPDQYSITYDAAAHTAGFADVSLGSLSASPFTLDVPAAAAPATYNGTVTVRNSGTGCSESSPFTVTVTNHPPIAGTATYTRTSGTQLKIRISELLTNVTDADLDTISLVSVSPTTNGQSLTLDATYIFVPANTVADAFTYTVQDGYLGTNAGWVLINLGGDVFGGTTGRVWVTESNATAILSGIPGYHYSVQRATNVEFTLGISNFPTVTTPPSGQMTNVDDFSDLFGSPNVAVPLGAYYRLHYVP
jgi:hypothetical protein